MITLLAPHIQCCKVVSALQEGPWGLGFGMHFVSGCADCSQQLQIEWETTHFAFRLTNVACGIEL